MGTSTGVIPLPYHSICDFLLSITAFNVVWWKKNVKSMFQGGAFQKCPSRAFIMLKFLEAKRVMNKKLI